MVYMPLDKIVTHYSHHEVGSCLLLIEGRYLHKLICLADRVAPTSHPGRAQKDSGTFLLPLTANSWTCFSTYVSI
jgi:hypothetical protein